MGGDEQIKCCTKCHTNKFISGFRKNKKGKYGVHSVCRECMSYIERKKRQDGCTKHRDISKKYYEKNKDKLLEKNKKYRKINQKKIKNYEKNYRDMNREKILKYGKKWRELNLEKIKKDKVKYNKKNRNKINEYKRKYRKRYYKENPHIEIWRSTLKNALKRLDQNKTNKTIDILGYTPDELKTHLESLFTEGMTWGNYGDWHIDHIKPVSRFDKTTPVHIVNSLDNLQPLWATTRKINGITYEGNLNKSNKK